MISPSKRQQLEKKMAALNIREADLEEQFLKGAGPGGQKINKTSSVVWIKHHPTGTIVRCQQSRSQVDNRYFARKILADKIESQILGRKSAEQKAREKIRRQKRKRSKRAKEKILREKMRRKQTLTNRRIDYFQEKSSCGTGFVANILGYKSHEILEKGLEAVSNLIHRGAISADGKTGDGAGILTQIPRDLFRTEILKQGKGMPETGDLAVAMIFFPQNDLARERCRRFFEETAEKYRLKALGWRKVPVNPDALGDRARETQPVIEQFLVARGGKVPKKNFERTLFLVRKEIESLALEHSFFDLHIASFSSRTIVYKGFLLASQLQEFFLDLKNPDYTTALTLFHQRFSTNTLPSWRLAQPFRYLAHNGEINTIAGNRNWMQARETDLMQLPWARGNPLLRPIIMPEGSDSFSFDNALETSLAAGRDLLQTIAMMIPEAWEKNQQATPDLKSFYEFHSCFAEPWDGPAAISFSDGRLVGAVLDRNGLRPARYLVTEEDLIIVGSEVGLIGIDESTVVEKGRLGPGMMIAVDTEAGRLFKNEEIKSELASRRPYSEWVKKNLLELKSDPAVQLPDRTDSLKRRQRAFGLTEEEIQLIIRAMAAEAKDPIFSMGDDTPLAVLSQRPRRLYNYFKQLFAQVTNPPIDPIREEQVMSLETHLGAWGNYFLETPEHAGRLSLPSPTLLPADFEALKRISDPRFQSITFSTTFPVDEGVEGIEDQLLTLCEAVRQAVAEGTSLIILSDEDIDQARAPLPMLLAVAAVHHYLIREGLRMHCAIIVATGDAFDIHHFACLLGYGAAAYYPYLVYETIQDQVNRGFLPNLDPLTASRRLQQAADHGILKIMSKMGISTLSSYKAAQIFEAIGLKKSFLNHYFPHTPSRIGGIGLLEIARDHFGWHRQAYAPGGEILPLGGNYRFRRGEEYHAFHPDVVKSLHAYVESGDPGDYRKFRDLVQGRPPTCLRDLLDFQKMASIPIEEVEPIEKILKRFSTSSISFGALSQEAHETLAVAMNRIGAKSGSGEGGEDPARFKPLPNGDSKNSAIKQVASARFGVTTEYLVSAQELEIKMAQGSKPGEGGQLPGQKVSAEIARVRHAQAGITLISPPPHHDIYSIEDLKQLVYDLKQVNPTARVGVKLVSESGVGTIAAGVVKAHADTILISGHEGGTGASPLSSIKNAGSPWEIGLTETRLVLIRNGLRERVRLRVDGGIKSGRDVVMAAILGADEFGFGTAALVAEGCVMARQCHLNTCPVGVTTHNPELRKKYKGTPEGVIRYFEGVAGEVREILATLGFKSLEELIGQVDLLKTKDSLPEGRAKETDLQFLLEKVEGAESFSGQPRWERNDPVELDESLDFKIMKDTADALNGHRSVKLSYPIYNRNRTIGGRIAGEIARRYGNRGLPKGIEMVCEFHGSAGQSFGAFLLPGMRWILSGEANDYVGKGMTGGEIIIRPSPKSKFKAEENTIAGNTILYGATGGEVCISGQVGERFCVRNSGATAVVEGIGDHGCEYMTGGIVVILGPVGRNFGAGMSGGVAFLLDEKGNLREFINPELVTLSPLKDPKEGVLLRSLVEKHLRLTGSPIAERILKKWPRFEKLFRTVHPKELSVVQHLTAAVGFTDEPVDESTPTRA